jgi:hypothetical protein
MVVIDTKGGDFLEKIMAKNVKCSEVRKMKPGTCLLDLLARIFSHELSEQIQWRYEGRMCSAEVGGGSGYEETYSH